ncbi:MAG: hypothetical protein A2047_04755 [Omnitrophica bacterium GWA2_41_15]|nr:MAG: hypothetical protein A2047_04755 [Omnitrophica bacterium GWA2_41_15]HAZ10021.1 hypothetical protein [Candidatus Omnitrophota bacterium]
MKNNLKFTLLAIGIVVVFFIMGRDIIETRAKLRKTYDQIVQEKKEKTWLQDELKTTKGELIKTDRGLRTANSKLSFVNKKILGLKGNNSRLVKEKQGLEYKIALLQEEKRAVETRFHSLSELKKAIRQVKLEMRDDRIEQREERIRQQREIDKWETALGNQGFFTKDGENYYKPKVKIDVRPANLSLNKK